MGISIFNFFPLNASSKLTVTSYCKSEPLLLLRLPPPPNGEESPKKFEKISSNEKLESKPPPMLPSTPA